VLRHAMWMAGAALVLALPARAADPQIKFEKYQLPNGLTVILSEDHRLPQVAVDIWYHVGAANQQIKGCARHKASAAAWAPYGYL